MFKSQRCPNCGETIRREYRFCPHCGYELRNYGLSIFRDVEREFERLDKLFSKAFRFPELRVRPLESGGISISIRSGTGMEPRVEVKTFGKYKELEPEIKRRLGIKPAVEEVETKSRVAKVTEEAKTKVERVGNVQVIRIYLPGVRSEADIEVRRLEQSIEIKAFAKDKVYFSLIPVPSQARVSKEFKDGVLKLKVE